MDHMERLIAAVRGSSLADAWSQVNFAAAPETSRLTGGASGGESRFPITRPERVDKSAATEHIDPGVLEPRV
jgi:hypothetical protein